MEICILRKICTPGEADLAALLTGTPESVRAIAARAGEPVRDVRRRLFGLARRGIAWLDGDTGEVSFRLAPFIVGIYEAQLQSMDHELAHLMEEYLSAGGASGIMAPSPALHRVVPATDAVKSEAIPALRRRARPPPEAEGLPRQ